MRNRVILIVLFTITTGNILLASITKDLKKDFGAKGDGISNDSQAWAAAINFFNKKSNGKLFIPKGTYRIGEQKLDTILNNKVVFAELMYPALLRDATNILIEGEIDPKTHKPLSKLKYLDDLYYGYINPRTKGEVVVINEESEARLGSTLNIDFTCRGITIKNIELDGNIDKQIYHPIPPTMKRGMDIAHFGIISYGANELLLENIYSHHFGLDGFYIQTNRKALEEGKYHAIVRKCKSDFNCRQGLSFTTGTSLLLTHSEFTNTGKGRMRISPAANVDIENHDGDGVLQGIRIDNCLISNNKGGAGSINIAGKVKDIVISNSIIDVGDRSTDGNQGYAISSNFSPSHDLLVRNSRLRGKLILYGKDKKIEGDEKVLFQNCEIIDNANQLMLPDGQFMIDSYENTVFERCKIFVHSARPFLRLRDANGQIVSASMSSIFKQTTVRDNNTKKKIKNPEK